jgi:peptidoglycan/LPS O-acetylase OafA/YrhL
MFFCLSGFLVAGSIERQKTLIAFLGLRVIRIYPALVVEIFLSALLIGPLVTAVSLSQYFTGPLFFRYLLNSTGDISYYLPGVFLHNPYARIVNSQLWTVPFELLCYIALSVLVALGLKKHRVFLPIALVGFLIAVAIKRLVTSHGLDTPEVETGSYLVAYFLGGVCTFFYRDRIPYNVSLIVLALALSFALMAYLPGGDMPAAFILPYFTVGLGLTNFRRIAFIGFADFSYGIYLYGGVIGQLMIDRFSWSHQWYINFALTLPVTAVFAMFSWFAVERPALSLKSHVGYLERMWIGRTFRPIHKDEVALASTAKANN